MSEQVVPEQKMTEQERPEQVMFRSYGLFWREDRIFWGWGRGSAKGHLYGRKVDNATGKTTSKDQIDFKDQIGIYALYYNFELVYVGQVGANTDDSKGRTLFDRLKDHRDGRHSERWDRFSWFGLRDVDRDPDSDKGLTDLRTEPLAGVTRSQILNQFEAVMIALSEPQLNLQRGRMSKYATQYSQWYSQEELVRQANHYKEKGKG